jgi:hypothetical protein
MFPVVTKKIHVEHFRLVRKMPGIGLKILIVPGYPWVLIRHLQSPKKAGTRREEERAPTRREEKSNSLVPPFIPYPNPFSTFRGPLSIRRTSRFRP